MVISFTGSTGNRLDAKPISTRPILLQLGTVIARFNVFHYYIEHFITTVEHKSDFKLTKDTQYDGSWAVGRKLTAL